MDESGVRSKPKPSELEPVSFKPGSVKFSIIRFLGDRQHGITDQNKKVQRLEKLFVPEYGHYIPCAPYQTHFIFEEKRRGYCAYQCSCSSAAVVVGHQQYKDDMSATPTGELFVCLAHA